MQACGGVTFQSQGTGGFFNVALPTRAGAKWRDFWLYVKETTPEGELEMPQFSAERSEPRHLRVRKLPEGQMTNVINMLNAMSKLQKQGLKTINLYTCWLGRRLVPLRRRFQPMWKYTGQDDPDRQSASALPEKEFRAMLQNISPVVFSSWNEGLAPFTPSDKPAPTVRALLFVWRSIPFVYFVD